MAERSEDPRDAARRIVEQVLAERGEQVLAERGEPGPAPSGSHEMVVAPSTDLEPADEATTAAAVAADDPDDPRARARALVAEVLAARAALEGSAPAETDVGDATAVAEVPRSRAIPADTADVPAAPAAAVPSTPAGVDPSRVRARELVAAALADAERRAAEADAERVAAEAERERAAAERARREAERDRRIAAERRAAERRAVPDDAPVHAGPSQAADVPPGADAPQDADAQRPPRPPDDLGADPAPDPSTTMPMSVAELAASVGADAVDVSAEETHALPRHRDDADEARHATPPAAEAAGGAEPRDPAGATVALPVQPDDRGSGDEGTVEDGQVVEAEPVAAEMDTFAGGAAGADASAAERTAALGAPGVGDLWPEGPDAERRGQVEATTFPPPPPAPQRDEPAPAELPRGGALEASVEVEDRPRQRRTGRWLLTSLLGAIALAVLFPLAVDALRALVAL